MYRSGRLEKITDSIVEVDVKTISGDLNYNEIGIDEEIFRDATDLELPAKVRVVEETLDRKGIPKPLFYKEKLVDHFVVNPEDRLDLRSKRDLYDGYAAVSKYNRYIEEIIEEGYLTLNTTPSIIG